MQSSLVSGRFKDDSFLLPTKQPSGDQFNVCKRSLCPSTCSSAQTSATHEKRTTKLSWGGSRGEDRRGGSGAAAVCELGWLIQARMHEVQFVIRRLARTVRTENEGRDIQAARQRGSLGKKRRRGDGHVTTGSDEVCSFSQSNNSYYCYSYYYYSNNTDCILHRKTHNAFPSTSLQSCARPVRLGPCKSSLIVPWFLVPFVPWLTVAVGRPVQLCLVVSIVGLDIITVKCDELTELASL